jgi:hypothetical protein
VADEAKHLKKLIIVLFLLLSLLGWIFISPKQVSGTSPSMVFTVGEGLEDLRIQQEKLVAEALEAHKKAELENLKNELRKRAEKLRGTYQGQCVIAVRVFLFGHRDRGRSEIQGWAKSLRINSHDPTIGAIVLLDTANKHDHAAVTIDFTEDTILVYESNYISGGVAGIREIPRNSPQILGYRVVDNLNINY